MQHHLRVVFDRENMAVDDRTRLNLLRRLEAVLGQEEAETLMAHLPPVTWQEVVTKTDLRVELNATTSTVRGELTEVRAELRTNTAELRTEMAGLRTEMAELRTELRTEMAELRTELRTEMADLRTELRTEIAHAVTSQTWRLATFIGTWSVLLVTVTALLR
jgi:predicted  nucleic acid-binding Zn-ribbon protein